MILHTMKLDQITLLKGFTKHSKNFKGEKYFIKKNILQAYWDKIAWTSPYMIAGKAEVFLYTLLRKIRKRLIKIKMKKQQNSIVFTEQWRFNRRKRQKI